MRLNTVTPLSKGIALTLFIVLPVFGFYLGMHFQHSYDTIIFENKCSSVRLSKNRAQSPALLTPTTSPSARIQTGIVSQTTDLIVVADIDVSTDIIATLPQGSSVNYDTESGFMRATVTIDSQSYRFIAEAGGRGSFCPNNCWSEDVPLQLNSGSTTSLRIWQESSGIFMLNPWSIPVDSYDINHLEITKINSDDVFTPEEVDLWKDIIKTIRDNHYQAETLDLDNLKD